jgi:aminoglycoside/choline kinase family phosphotransferase
MPSFPASPDSRLADCRAADPRVAELERWLNQLPALQSMAPVRLAPASSDASFRRYFRVTPASDSASGSASGSASDSASGSTSDTPATSLIAMDAPPDKEDCRPFVRIAGLLTEAGLHVPQVLAQDLAQGFLLLSDLGQRTYLQALRSQAPDPLYRDAMAALVRLQAASRPDVLPPYDRALMLRELQLLPEWYLQRQLQVTLTEAQQQQLQQVFDVLLENCLQQPQVWVHRDYHSRNLMQTTPNPGVLDFQDAVYGPITYDLVSLLRDAYIQWEEAEELEWCIGYWESARKAGLPVRADFAEFYRDYEWMGAQRQIKVVGIFARLALRDGKQAYLDDQPQVLRLLLRTCRRYRELAPLAALIDELLPQPAQTGMTF